MNFLRSLTIGLSVFVIGETVAFLLFWSAVATSRIEHTDSFHAAVAMFFPVLLGVAGIFTGVMTVGVAASIIFGDDY